MNKSKHQIEGMCVYCSVKKPIQGKRFCDSCQQQWLKHQKKRREENKRKGTCIYCKNKAMVDLRWCQDCQSKRKIKEQEKKDQVFNNYGGYLCVCCGEANRLFLTVDHVEGGGNTHRKNMKTDIYSWLIKHDFPSGFQVLCYNCNCGRQRNGGICPHKTLS